MREHFAEAIEQALTASKPSPSNEQETCFRIIDPLLLAMGYGYQEIKIQDKDNAKQKPDYSILPNEPDFTWFLEAKAWDITLDDNHAIQAVNYANTQGKRWVVLSNGREWRLYDNFIIGTVAEKSACGVALGDADFGSFLDALSKASILQSKLADYVQNQRLYSFLATQIVRTDSEVIKSIVKSLKSVPGLNNVKASDVVRFLSDYSSPADTAPVVPETPRGLSVPKQGSAPCVPEPVLTTASTQSWGLGSAPSTEITGKKLLQMELPDKSAVAVDRWNQLTVQATLLALREGHLEIPCFVSARSKSPVVARKGSGESESIREPIVLPAPFEEIIVEGHFSADGHQKAAAAILRSSGIEPSTIRFTVTTSSTPRG